MDIFAVFCYTVNGDAMNTFQDNYFDFRLQGELNLHYCGNREGSLDHKYVHRQAAYLLTYVVAGEACLTVNGKELPLSAGDVYVLFPESMASYVTAPGVPWSIRWVTLTGTQLEELLPMLGFTPETPIVKAAAPSKVEQLLQELFSKTVKADLRSKIAAMALLYELLSCLGPSSPSLENTAIDDAVRYISRHYHEPITIHALAERAYLNSNYFSKLFTAQVGTTPQQFITYIRMEKAKELLRYTELTVGEVAATVGYSDALYFSRVFKRYTGMAPSAFRSE